MKRHDRTVAGRTCTAWVPRGGRKPVLLALHGGGGTADGFAATARFHERTSDFIVVYPQAVNGVWNTGAEENGGTEDDVAFLDAVLDDITARFRARDGKHYATGFSNGAAMCYRMANERSDRIAAIAPVGGVLDFVPLLPGSPIDILHQHGVEDPIYPYQGGESRTGKTREAVPDHFTRWTDRAGSHTLAPITGMGHCWPGDDYGRAQRLKVGPPRPDLDATGAVLGFLQGA